MVPLQRSRCYQAALDRNRQVTLEELQGWQVAAVELATNCYYCCWSCYCRYLALYSAGLEQWLVGAQAFVERHFPAQEQAWTYQPHGKALPRQALGTVAVHPSYRHEASSLVAASSYAHAAPSPNLGWPSCASS